MFESFTMSVLAVCAGACLTFLTAILLPEPVAAKGARGGLYAGLGEENDAPLTRARRANAPLPWRAPRFVGFSRRRARSAGPARAH
ncbi:hypothetical protein [Paraburkholderia acidisoli]|uniref:Uncharacterized protein n=1 Tax=Paraburkholderia acidisoli TaxID=2571748 RepID=A0A7Z2JJ89_9BURK|nr:hypothetical protein [Paraburkholderia acidisoli]QGZ65963.1 hypothetical protein FAZ98_29525 [Paraburkholderia acidisoli]